jgi:PKD repeat protein
MKKLILLCIFTLASLANIAQPTANDLIIHGYVTAGSEGLAQEGYPVNIILENTILQTVFTNNNGWYTATIIGGSQTGPNQTFEVTTEDTCTGNILSQSISNNQGTINEATASFVVCESLVNPCNASFEVVINGNSIYGINQSTGTLLSYTWSIDGVEIFNTENLSFTFPVTGEYVVCLHVVSGTMDPIGCEDTYCQTVNFSQDTTNTGCMSSFTSEISASNPLRALLNGSSSYVGPNASYSWTFGDNSTANTMNAEHTYNQAGTYNVCLIVASGICADTLCSEVYVPGNNTLPCDAEFTWNQTNTNPSNTEALAAFTSAYGPNEESIEHAWLVDGEFRTSSANPSMGFNIPGTYTVCHAIYNTQTACADTSCQIVSFNADTNIVCTAYFTSSISQSNPMRALLSNQSNPGQNTGATYFWDLGDGSTATTFNVEHTYASNGIYYVCLTVSSGDCSNTYCLDVVISSEVPTDFSIGGQVFAGNQLADIGSARLFSIDQTSNAVELIQTASIDSGFYVFNNVASGLYIIKAGLSETSDFYGQYVPTYFGSQFYWVNAETVFVDANGFTYNISLIYAGNPGGNGTVNGDIDDGPYRLSGSSASSASTLVSGADVFVTDFVGNPQRFTVSNLDGTFQINDLAYGTYRLFSDITGMLCVPVEFTLSAETPNVSINLVMGELVLSTSTVSEVVGSNIYPNPASEIARIDLNLNASQTVNMSLVAADGKIVWSSTQVVNSGKQSILIPVSTIAKGFYFLKLNGMNNQVIGVRKLSVIH